MIRARKVTGLAARGVALAAAFAAAAAPQYAFAQAPAAAPAAAAPAAPAAPRGLSESVAAVVNDDIISTYDLAQRMRLLIATSGIQPTQQNIAQFQRGPWSRWSTSVSRFRSCVARRGNRRSRLSPTPPRSTKS